MITRCTLFFAAALCTLAPLRAAEAPAELVWHWDVEVSKPLAFTAAPKHGETFRLEPRLLQYGAPVTHTGSASFRYRSQKLDPDKWYTAPAAWNPHTSRLTVTFTLGEGSQKIHFLTKETDPTIPAWAKAPAKPTYSHNEIIGLDEKLNTLTDTLGNPCPPFAYSSGLDWTDVSEEEALRLGLQPDGGPLPGVSLAPSNREILMAMKSTGLSAEQLLPPEASVMNKQHPFYKCPKCGKFTGYDGHCSKCGHVLPQDEMIQRGKEALKKATTGKEKNVKGAMYKEGLGRIDFWLGYKESGLILEPKPHRDAGHGIVKIQQKHFKEMKEIPETIVKGEIYPHWNKKTHCFDRNKRVIVHETNVAILVHQNGGWYLDTHYTSAEKAHDVIEKAKMKKNEAPHSEGF